jgi:hypothetical protein
MCHLLTLLGAHPIFHINRIRVKEVIEYVFKKIRWSISTPRVKNVWGNLIRTMSSRRRKLWIAQCGELALEEALDLS